MISIAASQNIIYPIPIRIDVILIQISAQHRRVGFPVALGAVGFGAGEAAIDGHAAFHPERQRPVVVRQPGALVGVVHPRRHPDFIACLRRRQRILERRVGIGPGTAIVGPRRVFFHVDDPLRLSARAQKQCHHQPGGQTS